MKILNGLMLVVAVSLWTALASAGTVVIHDSTGFLPSGDVAQLQTDQGAWPFDVHVLVEKTANQAALEDDAHKAVTSPNVLVIGIDPTHHRTVVRFGTGTGVKAGDYDSVSQAGNAHFRAGEKVQAIEAILIRAKASKDAVTAISTSATPVVVQGGLSTGTWLFISLLVVGFAGLAIWLYRRSKKNEESFKQALDENKLETQELRSRNIEESDWADGLRRANAAREQSRATGQPVVTATQRQSVSAPTTYQPPVASAPAYVPPPRPVYAPATAYAAPQVVVQQSSSNNDGFLTGLLVGETLSSGRRERDVIIERDREVVREDRSYRSSRRDDDDAGGSSSSWDDSSSSTSSTSDDAGGSTTSWDPPSAPSFDSGDSGGSNDGGGGGGSWDDS